MSLLLFLLFFRTSSYVFATDLAEVLERYPAWSAAESATALLPALRGTPGTERDAALFLLGADFAELGLEKQSLAIARTLRDSPWFAPPALVLALRVHDQRESPARVLETAASASWEGLDREDFGEAAFRVARASLARGRTAEARTWVQKIAPESPYASYARYLLVQIEIAAGDLAAAVRESEPLFEVKGAEALRARAAILLGETATEAGRYPDAAALFRWAESEEAFAPRAERGELIAESLAALDSGKPAEAETRVARATAELEKASREIEATVADERARGERVAELRLAWPPRETRRARRTWAAKRTAERLTFAGGWTGRRVAETVWMSLPPVALFALAEETTAPDVLATPVRLGRESGFFFAPDRQASRLLAALALIEQAAGEREPSDEVALRIAAYLTGVAPEPPIDELERVIRGKSPSSPAELEPIAVGRLSQALLEAAAGQSRELQRKRYALDRELAQLRRNAVP